MRVWRHILVAGAGVMMFAGGAEGQVIRLERGAGVEVHQDVRLGDVAKVSGTDAKTAESLANLVILPDVKEGRTIRAESVLMAVITQIGPGSLADHLQVAGSATCEITVGGGAKKGQVVAAPVVAAVPAVAAAAPVKGVASAGVVEAKDAGSGTLAQCVRAELLQDLGVRAKDMNVSFTTANPLLDQATPEGKKWVFRSLNRTFLGTVQFDAQLVEGDRMVQRCTLQMQVMKRQQVLTATAPLAKGDVVTAGQFRAADTWIDRQMPTLFQDGKDILGLQAVRAIDVGATLDQRDFAPVEMAHRSEVLSVFFVHGNLQVQMKGVAMQSGKYHDSIPVKNDSTGETYQATLIGKRLAVVGGPLDESQEKQLREAR